MGGEPVLDGNGVVALAPDDQRGEFAEQVEPVHCADVLAAYIDDRAEGLQERLACGGLLKRAHRAADRLEVDPPAATASPHSLAGSLDRLAHAAVRHHPDPGGRTRERGAAEHRADLMAEAAA